MLRAYHPVFGWSRPVKLAFAGLFLSALVVLLMVAAATVQSFYATTEATRIRDRMVQRVCGTYLAAYAVLPVVVVVAAWMVPRKTPIDKFGSGPTRTKFGLLVFTSGLLAMGAIFRAAVAFEVRPVSEPAWFHSKACFYCFNFVLELAVVFTFAAGRFDRRFHVRDGCSGPGHYSWLVPGKTMSDDDWEKWKGMIKVDEESRIRDDDFGGGESLVRSPGANARSMLMVKKGGDEESGVSGDRFEGRRGLPMPPAIWRSSSYLVAARASEDSEPGQYWLGGKRPLSWPLAARETSSWGANRRADEKCAFGGGEEVTWPPAARVASTWRENRRAHDEDGVGGNEGLVWSWAARRNSNWEVNVRTDEHGWFGRNGGSIWPPPARESSSWETNRRANEDFGFSEHGYGGNEGLAWPPAVRKRNSLGSNRSADEQWMIGGNGSSFWPPSAVGSSSWVADGRADEEYGLVWNEYGGNRVSIPPPTSGISGWGMDGRVDGEGAGGGGGDCSGSGLAGNGGLTSPAAARVTSSRSEDSVVSMGSSTHGWRPISHDEARDFDRMWMERALVSLPILQVVLLLNSVQY
ncbi:hypothetical protein VTI74DRAFT_2541 [Chaetomium olivicolor]